MATITLKGVPEELHLLLKNEADAHYRDLEQEVIDRLKRSLDSDSEKRRDQEWIDEAMRSGPEEPFSKKEFAAALKRGIEKGKSNGR